MGLGVEECTRFFIHANPSSSDKDQIDRSRVHDFDELRIVVHHGDNLLHPSLTQQRRQGFAKHWVIDDHYNTHRTPEFMLCCFLELTERV
jgi:hypothetical protein